MSSEHLGRFGFGSERLFFGLLLQFMEDLSDRELERSCQENTGVKWFCGFGLTENTPDHSVFCKARRRKEPLRRSVIESVIVHLKGDGHLGRGHLKETLGDQQNALLTSVETTSDCY